MIISNSIVTLFVGLVTVNFFPKGYLWNEKIRKEMVENNMKPVKDQKTVYSEDLEKMLFLMVYSLMVVAFTYIEYIVPAFKEFFLKGTLLIVVLYIVLMSFLIVFLYGIRSYPKRYIITKKNKKKKEITITRK